MKKVCVSTLMSVALCLTMVSQVHALSLAPGYDLYSIKGGSSVAFDPDGPGGLDPIPVPVTGIPIDASLFNTSAIIQRQGGQDPFNVGDEAHIQNELLALLLRSTRPIELNNTQYGVVYVFGNAQLGQSTIKKTQPSGGTFDSFFDIFFEIQLTDINDPNNSFKLNQ